MNRERCGRWKSDRDGDQESNGFALIRSELRNKLDDGWPNFFQSICLNAKQVVQKAMAPVCCSRTHIYDISIQLA